MLAALQDAAGPMTPKEIQVAAELSSRNATDILLSKMVKATEIVRTGPGRYCLPPDRQNRRKIGRGKRSSQSFRSVQGWWKESCQRSPLKIKNKKPICPVFPTCLGSNEREQRKSARVSGANRSDGGR